MPGSPCKGLGGIGVIGSASCMRATLGAFGEEEEDDNDNDEAEPEATEGEANTCEGASVCGTGVAALDRAPSVSSDPGVLPRPLRDAAAGGRITPPPPDSLLTPSSSCSLLNTQHL